MDLMEGLKIPSCNINYGTVRYIKIGDYEIKNVGNSSSIELKNEVIGLYFQGNSIDEIHKITGTSTGNISNIIKQCKENLKNGDPQDTVSFIRILKKQGISALDALNGARVANVLDENNADFDDFITFLEIYLKSKEQRLDLQDLLTSSQALFEIQSKTNMKLEEIPNYYEEKLKQKEELEKKLTFLKACIRDNRDELASKIKEKETTLEILDEFEKTQKVLRKHKLDVTCNQSFAKMIQIAQAEDYNISEIALHLSKEGTYEDRIYQNQHKIKQQEIEIKQNQQTIRIQEEKIDSNRDILFTISTFSKIQIDQYKLKKVFEKINSISKKHKITPKQAFSEFEKTISYYDDIKTIEQSIFEKKNEKKELEQNVGSLTQEQNTLANQNKKLHQEKIKLQNDCEIIKNNHLIAIKNFSDNSKVQFSEIQKRAKETGDNVTLQIKNTNETFLISFEKLLFKSIESNEVLKNCYSLKAIPDLIKGKGSFYESAVAILSLLSGFIQICQNNKADPIILNLIKDLHKKLAYITIWKAWK